MAKQPEERAVELLGEMDALIRTCERQLEETQAFYSANGIDVASVQAQVDALPAKERRELEDAIARDMQEVEDDIHRAKLNASHAPRTGMRKMRPMV